MRFVKGSVARALRVLREAMHPAPADRVVPLSPQMVGLRFTAARMVAHYSAGATAERGAVARYL